MRFLLTNDDGINSLGLHVLKEALTPFGEVFVFAPAGEMSAVGHSITLNRPLRVVGHRDREYAVHGTPTDCVVLAVHHFLRDNPPGVVFSGINHGANLGADVTYSGTVAAAMEGLIMGIPSVAVSLAGESRDVKHFETARAFVEHLVKNLCWESFPREVLLNINVPDIPLCDVKGLKVVHLGARRYADVVSEGVDAQGNIYYTIGGTVVSCGDGEDTDTWAIEQGYVTITPIHLDLTARRAFKWLYRQEDILGGFCEGL